MRNKSGGIAPHSIGKTKNKSGGIAPHSIGETIAASTLYQLQKIFAFFREPNLCLVRQYSIRRED